MTKPQEYFIDIPGYEGYYKMSNYGRVWGVKRNKIIKSAINKKDSRDCSIVNLSKEGVSKTFVLHTLVYMCFYGRKPIGMIEFNDGNPHNCSIYNMKEVNRTAAFSKRHCIPIKDTVTGTVFSSVTELANKLNVSVECVCVGLSKKTPKYNRYQHA